MCLWELLLQNMLEMVSAINDKYYFPLLKLAALVFSTFIWKPTLQGDGILMFECAHIVYFKMVVA